MGAGWRWEVFLERTPFGEGTYLGWFVSGLGVTLALSIAAWTIALALGTALGVLRTVPSRAARAVGAAYVDVFRNVPLLVQLFIWYFVVPEVVPPALGAWLKGLHPATLMFVSSAACLGTFTAARICEQVRAGIEALGRGQRAAALALGLTLPQAYRHVLLPMAFRIIVPPLTSEMVNLVKNSAVASTVGLLELAAMARQLVDFTALPYESFVAVTLAYVAVNLLVIAAMRVVEARARVPGFIGGGR
ncbi:MAG TPA: amino acid ABC transporter permease [Anaeromyxobacter sp.]|nr:amino acid ABC transporter permease [Anaeromyxobacter sp.]